MLKKEFYAQNDEEVRVIFDPYRRKIIRVFLSSLEPFTVKQVADILGEHPSKVHYHVMKLLSIGVIKLVHTEVIRGIVAKYYQTEYVGFHMNTSNLSRDTLPILKRECEIAYDRISTEFSSDLKSYYESLESKGEAFQRMLVLRNFKLYMTESEQQEVIQMFSDIIEKYSKKDDSKEEYSALTCLVRTR